MATLRTMSSITLATILTGGAVLPASAQQPSGAPPAYGPPPTEYREPPPLDPAARNPAPVAPDPSRRPSSGQDAQLYSQPAGSVEMPAPPSRTNPYAGPGPIPNAPSQDSPPSADDATGSGFPPSGSPRIQEDRGIRYVSGGIGEGERVELDALSSQFNLRLLFAQHGSGNYLADVRVRILNSRGEAVLNAGSEGPWFFAQLPPGAYTVEVGASEQTQRQTVRIQGSRQSRLNFYWR